MRREKKRVVISVALSCCIVFTTEFGSVAADTQSEAQAIETINHETQISPLAGTWEEIPDMAAAAVETQEWHGKALASTDGETDVVADAAEGSQVVGKMYSNTIVTIEENGVEWSKISSGTVVGYVKNTSLAFGTAAVERAKLIDMSNPQAAKTLEEIAAEEAARKAAEEAARKAAEEAARKAAEEEAKKAARYETAMSASADDKTLIAAIIYCEAGNQPHDGKVGVGAVILNRVRSSAFPNTIREVIYQRGQFGPAITGKLDRIIASGNIPAACYQAAEDALAGYNPIGDALYFGNGNYGQLIGDHYFH